MKFAAPRTLGLFVVLLAIVSPADAEPPISVATNPTYVPFESRDVKSHEMVGYDIDILHAIAHQAGLDYNLKLINFDGIIPALISSTVDMAISGITITSGREKKVDFSNPYYSSGLRLLVRSGDSNVKSLKDLKGKRVATETGTTAYNYLKAHAPSTEIKLFPASNQMYMALMNRNADAVLFDEPSIAYFVKNKGNGRVETVGPLYHGEFYGMAFPSGSPLRKRVNAALLEIKNNGTLTRLYNKWFNQKPPEALLSAIK